MAIASFSARFFETMYELSETSGRETIIDRMIFKPVLHRYNATPRRNFYAGTKEGDVIQGTWEGQEFDSGEIVNFENCQFVCCAKYHDGPVVSIDYSPKNNAILTVGGRIFALWREDFKNRPIVWRKCVSIYTSGTWYDFEEASMKLIRMDGYVEVWTLFYKSKEPLRVRLTSNGAVNITKVHPRRLKMDVFGLCDYRGSFRLFYMAHQSPLVIKSKEECMSAFLTREIDRKREFLEWQNEWNARFLEKLKQLAAASVEEEKEPVFEFVEPEKRREKPKVPKAISAGERYLQYVKEQYQKHEEQRIKSIILAKKQLNTEQLLKQSAPLRKLEEELEIKKRKQKAKLKDSDKLFRDTVAMLFPEAIKEKPPPPPDPYQRDYEDNVKLDTFQIYKGKSIEAQDFVEEHPFKYDFKWVDVLKQGRIRRRRLDERFDRITHFKRHQQYKKQRGDVEGEAEEIDVQEKSSGSMLSSRSAIEGVASSERVAAEEDPVKEPKIDEIPVKEPKIEEFPVKKATLEEIPVREPKAEETAAKKSLIEEVPVKEPRTEETVTETAAEGIAAQETATEEPTSGETAA